MDPVALRGRLDADRAAGDRPFLLVGTAGTTGAGIIDPLPELAAIAREYGLWFHVDAAWGGAAALVPELREALAGLEHGDSITLDAHKLLSVPMGAGIYITRHPEIQRRTFETRTGYMPREARDLPVTDPYSNSIQWSRRFTGLKLFLTLAVAGWEGYEETIRSQIAIGDALRERLLAANWTVVNRTPLPVVCFVDGTGRVAPERLVEILSAVLRSGEAWISVTPISGTGPALRACITNYRTGPADLDRLVAALNRARDSIAASGRPPS
jgi:glutamate/tyrosine decarboxylase-like PLP-dependent enzyme